MWTKESLQEALRVKLKGYKFIIVSNRQPYIHEYSGGKIRCVPAISGVTIALDPVMRSSGGLWIAYGSGDADRDVVDEHNKIAVPPENPQYTLKRVWLTKEEEDGYYYGYANQSLWPISHISYEKPVFLLNDWKYYVSVNKKFAESVLEELGKKKNFIWLHDYHLALCARYIKEKRPDCTVSLFWHIPWPNPEVFRICPQKIEILEGLLSNDLLGFHLRYHCHNFLSTIEQELEAKVDWEEMSVTFKTHKTLVRPFPISVDFLGISEKAATDEVTQAMERISSEIDPTYELLGIGIDRIDYTKGLLERLHAIDRFLEKYPQYQGRFVFIQIGALSRIHIKTYKRLIENVQTQAEEINWKYRQGRWYPIVIMNRRIDFATHLAFYRMSDLCIVSSLHDGMNLVAKEFLAANIDKKGMIILSQFTGAARELQDNAVLVNPYDVDGFADAIKEALEMSLEEKRMRIEKMRAIVKENNIYRWAGKFMSNLFKLE